MATVSIITPWKDHVELIPDYERSVQGAQVIVVDNASLPDAARQIRAMVQRLNGVCLRNETNAGFSAANNQGMAAATGDVLLFLNNDIVAEPGFVEHVRRDVAAGDVLMGPWLQHHVVYMTVRFLEGSCVAGRREVWDRLGGWDAAAYAGFYWEDVDLCFRALLAGVKLTRVPWPIQHKGMQTSESLMRWGELWEQNRATFAARVRPVYLRLCAEQGKSPDQSFLKPKSLAELYREACGTPSDINEHCPTLYGLAQQCSHVTEMGTRAAVSTTALLFAQPETLTCYDLSKHPRVEVLRALAGRTRFTFHEADVLQAEIEETDLLFIDTWHVYGQLQKELQLHAPKVRRFIVLHDTTTFGSQGETAGHAGLWPAVEEFLTLGTFRLVRRYENNNGLTVLESTRSAEGPKHRA